MKAKVVIRIALTAILILVGAPLLVVIIVALTPKAHGAELVPSKVQACEKACSEVKKPVKKKVRPNPCATEKYSVEPGDEVRFVVAARELLPASACWQLCDGDTCSALPSPCDEPCGWAYPESIVPAGFVPQHSGKYVAKHAKQSLRFPKEVKNNYIALCVTRAGLGQSDSWIVPPKA